MTTLTLARAAEADRLLPLVVAFQAEAGIEQDEATRSAALIPLLEGSPHGAVYLVGPQRAPIGFVVVTFGWSLDLGGLDGCLDTIYIRPGVRGRGIGSEILLSLPRALSGAGLRALHLEVPRDDAAARALYERLHFKPCAQSLRMTRRF